MICTCKLCLRNKLFREKLQELPEDKRNFFEDIYECLLHTEMDLEYHESLVKGGWPDSDVIIANARQKHFERSEK